jgi:hypothetical protein
MLILAENNTFLAFSMHFFIIQHYFNPFLSDWEVEHLIQVKDYVNHLIDVDKNINRVEA